MIKEKVIKCDFNRSGRRSEMAEIELRTTELMQSLYNSFEFSDIDVTALEEITKLDKRYAELLKEEKELGLLRYGK